MFLYSSYLKNNICLDLRNFSRRADTRGRLIIEEYILESNKETVHGTADAAGGITDPFIAKYVATYNNQCRTMWSYKSHSSSKIVTSIILEIPGTWLGLSKSFYEHYPRSKLCN